MTIVVSTRAQRGAAILSLCALALLSGCAGVKRVAISPSERTRFTSVKTVVGLNQQELTVAVNQSNTGAAVGGILGAIIDSAVTNSRAKDAEAAVAPVRDALVSADTGAALKVALAKELPSVSWLKAGEVEVRQVPDKSAVAKLAEPGDTKYLLLVEADYRLAPAFDALVCSAKVSLRPRVPPPPEESLPPPTYLNEFTATTTLAGLPAGATLADAAALWAANDGAAARLAVDGGMAELARMIAFDLGEAAPAEGVGYADAPGAAQVKFVQKLTGLPATGAVVRRSPSRTWARLASGDLASVDQVQQ